MKLEKKNYKVDLLWVKGKAREVISEAVQKKAFELGYRWRGGDSNIGFADQPHLFFYWADKCICYSANKDFFEILDKSTEVSVNDWLNCDGFKEKTSNRGVDFDLDGWKIGNTEWKLGKTIKYNGKIYRIYKETNACDGCAFFGRPCPFWVHGCATDHVIYKEVK